MQEKSVITRSIEVAGGVHAPGHLGELTQIIDFDLVDAVLEETGTREKRLRLLPSRVVVYFVLALALLDRCSYRATWGKLTAALAGLCLTRPSISSLSRARRRVGVAPLRRLFETLAGAVGLLGQPGVFYRGLRTVAIDGTHLHVPDEERVTWRYPKRVGDKLEFGYPLLRLLVVIECGTRALLAAAFGPETEGELAYARRLLGVLDRTMLLLADAGFDAAEFLRDVGATGAQFLVRSSARRCPTIQRRLPDGSYLARIGYGSLPALILVRVIEAQVTVTLADGSLRREQWRLITSLTDHTRYPAHELVDLYHERWQAETTYFSIKATMLDGRVLRSRSIPGIEQEVYALLTAYQALIRAAADATCTQPGLDMDRISFTILIDAAADTITTASGILPGSSTDLLGTIGHAALADLLPAWRRPRIKARSRKNPTSKYSPNAGQHPATTQTYTFHADITIFEKGLASRSRR
ncbi:IS4 family transposase [Micromonospora olivasterospora]|uniref:DDE family transposase n=2 Tax=Micromonospora olivasterospora TaxID=1880 RepID=A0A562IF72_MICOL|nr:IS4 family transposase [Micromonospora olivasterospora]TWH69552.1 DDE family transposase [Micromonospora olivasterospora]